MDNLDNNTCLYLHIKPESKEVFYVGIGTSKRPYEKGKRRSELWNRVINKYSYEVIILADNLSWKDACEKEIYLINYYGRRDLGKGTLVNLTDGGDGTKGVIMSAEARVKIGAFHKGRKRSEETKAKISAVQKGKVLSEETKAKISASGKGKKRSEETKARMSKARKGKFLGKKHTEEQKAKISKKLRGECSNSSKLTESQVISILIELRNKPYFGQNVDLSEKYGVNRTNISMIKNNKRWKHICRETLTIR